MKPRKIVPLKGPAQPWFGDNGFRNSDIQRARKNVIKAHRKGKNSQCADKS